MEGSSATMGFLPAVVAVLVALLRRWLGRATAGEVLMERVSLEMGVASRDDMVKCVCERMMDGSVG